MWMHGLSIGLFESMLKRGVLTGISQLRGKRSRDRISSGFFPNRYIAQHHSSRHAYSFKRGAVYLSDGGMA